MDTPTNPNVTRTLSALERRLVATTITHDYEPGDTRHPMSADPECRICGERRH